MGEDDDKGSRAIPSRTSLGIEAAFVKDFPAYGIPRRRLGRWEMNFGYRWILTVPQIEIMQADLPHTLYKKTGKDGKPVKNTKASDEVIRLQEEANRKMLERKAAKERGEIPYESTDELFNS